MGLAVWSAIVGNLNWSIFILLGLSIGLMNEELIAAIVGTEIFERWGCRGRRLIEPLTEEKVERTMMRAIGPSSNNAMHKFR
mmetsp:Transcript_12310/g.12160  ORF Transcript_12310/g.12160 Transcript_12310/m.12160 type:complete len:82 (-) Transcript_12310:12-257(-)